MTDSMFMDGERCNKAPSWTSEFTLPWHVLVYNFKMVFYFLDVIFFIATVKFHLRSIDEWKTTKLRQIPDPSVSRSTTDLKGMAHHI